MKKLAEAGIRDLTTVYRDSVTVVSVGNGNTALGQLFNDGSNAGANHDLSGADVVYTPGGFA